jgi:hypothetical protein
MTWLIFPIPLLHKSIMFSFMSKFEVSLQVHRIIEFHATFLTLEFFSDIIHVRNILFLNHNLYYKNIFPCTKLRGLYFYSLSTKIERPLFMSKNTPD